jgi:hypothetical protein
VLPGLLRKKIMKGHKKDKVQKKSDPMEEAEFIGVEK